MSKNIVIGILGTIIVAGAGYYLLLTRGPSPAPSGDGLPATTTGVTEERRQDPMVGKWRAADDATFTREFFADGSFADRYQGDPSATRAGEWKRIASGSADLSGSIEAGLDTLELTIDGDSFSFGIVQADDATLELVDLGGGGARSFARVR